MNRNQRSLIIGILVGLSIGSLFCLVYAGSNVVWLRLTYPDLKVFANQLSTIEVYGVTYGFEFKPDIPYGESQYGSIVRSQGEYATCDLAAIKDSWVLSYPLQITVIEVQTDYVVLSYRVLK